MSLYGGSKVSATTTSLLPLQLKKKLKGKRDVTSRADDILAAFSKNLGKGSKGKKRASTNVLAEPPRKRHKNSKGKNVHFSPDTKAADGHTAKLYSCTDYLKRGEDGLLRPKTDQEIEKERQLGLLSETHNLSLALDSFIPVLHPGNDDDDEEYDPANPNDYEQFCIQRARIKQAILARERVRREIQAQAEKRQMLEAQLVAAQAKAALEARVKKMGLKLPKAPEKTKEVHKDGDTKKKGLSMAMRMMQKSGWKEGEGLGKHGQGIRGAIVHEFDGVHNKMRPTQDASRVLRLQNMVGPGEVDNDLREETAAECTKYGPVLGCNVHETKKKVQSEFAVSIFVQFAHVYSVTAAVQAFNGRFFAGRRVIASFFPEHRYNTQDFEPRGEEDGVT